MVRGHDGGSEEVASSAGDADPGPDEQTTRWREVVTDLLAVDRAVVDDVVADTGLLGVQADLLVRLARLPGQRSPMNALAGSMRVSGSSLTKLVDRLSDLGYARRDASENDRRVVYVVLTPEGIEEADRLSGQLVKALRSRVLATVGGGVVDLADVARRLA
ncbi:MarR family transcriptional regulator [Jatrophihabitans sp. YIM 134969]